MIKLRFLIGVCAVLAGILGSSEAVAQSHTFKVNMPRRVSPGATPPAGGPCQISSVRLTFSLASDPGVNINAVTVQITEPDVQSSGIGAGSPETWPATPLALTPGMATQSHPFQVPPPFGGVTPLFGDTVNVSAPDPAGYDSTRYQRYEIDFLVYSNYVDLDKSTQRFDPDVYTIALNVTTSDVTHPATLSGLCVESYDPLNRSITNAACSPPSLYFVPINNNPATLLVDGALQSSQQCFKERPAVEALLVLDKSGSMASSTLGSDPEPKIEALQEAIRDLVTAWQDARTNDSTPASDQIGAFLFDANSAAWTDGGLSSGLSAFTVAQPIISTNLNPATCTATSCGSVVPGTSTSIGAGLLSADSVFPTDLNRHVMLLMSDGMQNTDPMVEPDPSNPGRVATYCQSLTSSDPRCVKSGGARCTAASPCDLPVQMPIYAVTVGTGLAVSAAVNQGIASASGGFYINTEDNANQLKPFFLELLQNVLRFNSYDTIRMISQRVPPTTLPFSTSTPVSTTTHDVEFDLAWPHPFGALRLTVTPPGGARPIVQESASGFISIVQHLPLPAPFDPTGNWSILVERPTLSAVTAVNTAQSTFPFDIYVMADDGAIKSELSVVPGDYKAGDNIRLRAKLTQLGSPITGLGLHPGDKIQVNLIKPGQSIGDILSDSSASSATTGSDQQSPAEAKLFNTLQNNPLALVRNTDNPIAVALFDDGKKEHGDEVAGDGIYSALYPATLPGHYNFLFSIESTDPKTARFSRQQLRTAYVRAVPDPNSTVIQSSILRRDNANVLLIVMTPRVMPGPGCAKTDPKCGRMGPGWANYFWFTTPGQVAFKAKDNLDGTYTATLPFAGNAPPPVKVHFENVLAVIADSVPPDKLPDPLGPKNALTDVPPPCCEPPLGRLAVFFDAGAAVPHGTFGNAFNTGFSLNAGLEYIITDHFSAEGIFGYHHFPAKTVGGVVLSDLNLYQFSANGKAYLNNSWPFRPFVNAGIGGYDFTPGGNTYFGGNVGAGVLREFNSHWGVQASYNFHTVNTPGAATKFSTAQIGVRFVF